MTARRVLLALILVAAVASTLFAHDMFLKLESFFLEPDAAVTVPLLNGTFSTRENSIARPRIADIAVLGPAGRVTFDTTMVSARNDSTFFALRTSAAGTYVIGVSTRPNIIAMTCEQFHEYLSEEGLGHVIAARQQAGTALDSAREQYAKYVKAIVQVGDARSWSFGAALGYAAELVPLDNPYDWKPGGALRFRAVVNGVRVPSLTVISGGHTASGAPLPRRELRTAPDGVVTLRPTGPGVWYLTFIQIGPVAAPDHNYESQWDTITSSSVRLGVVSSMALSPRSRGHSPTSRTMAAAIALVVATAGSGLPMCASLLVQAATPCPMHARHPMTAAAAPSTAVVVAAHGHSGACHQGDAGPGCVTGGVCPATGSATPARPGVALAAEHPARRALWSRDLAQPSFLAAPLSPPPQA
jgi:hypothetical protein